MVAEKAGETPAKGRVRMTQLKRHPAFSTGEILDILKRNRKSESFRLHFLVFKLMLATNWIFFFL